MHTTTKGNSRAASANQPNRLIDTGSHNAYLHYARAVLDGRSPRPIETAAPKAVATARRRTAAKASTKSQAGGTNAAGAAQDTGGSGGAGGDGSSDGGEGDGDGPGRRVSTPRSRRRSKPAKRPPGHSPSSPKIDPDLPHLRGLMTLVLLTLLLLGAALIFGLTGHDALASQVIEIANSLPLLASYLVKPK